jgi:hypothetical protein
MEIVDHPDASREQQPVTTTGPQLVAGVFKLAAFVVLVFGAAGTFQLSKNLSSNASYSASARLWIIVLTIAGIVLMASAFAFFGYVLDLLREIRDN